MRRLSPLFAVLTLAAAVATGCGASNAVDPVAKAADATVSLGGIQITMTGSITVAGETVPMEGGGVMDNTAKSARMTITVKVPGKGTTELEELLKWPEIYMTSPLFKGQLPHGAKWLKIDLARTSKAMGVDLNSIQNPGGNATDMLRWLKSAKSKKVGSETIRGVRTTHYRSTIDLVEAAKQSGDAQARQSIERLQQVTGVKTLPADVWIDGKNRVRREHMGWSQRFTPNGPSGTIDMTMDFVKFGVTLALDIPSGDDVYDGTDEAARELAKQTGG